MTLDEAKERAVAQLVATNPDAAALPRVLVATRVHYDGEVDGRAHFHWDPGPGLCVVDVAIDGAVDRPPVVVEDDDALDADAVEPAAAPPPAPKKPGGRR